MRLRKQSGNYELLLKRRGEEKERKKQRERPI
jgi:hypothetical protein